MPDDRQEAKRKAQVSHFLSHLDEDFKKKAELISNLETSITNLGTHEEEEREKILNIIGELQKKLRQLKDAVDTLSHEEFLRNGNVLLANSKIVSQKIEAFTERIEHGVLGGEGRAILERLDAMAKKPPEPIHIAIEPLLQDPRVIKLLEESARLLKEFDERKQSEITRSTSFKDVFGEIAANIKELAADGDQGASPVALPDNIERLLSALNTNLENLNQGYQGLLSGSPGTERNLPPQKGDKSYGGLILPNTPAWNLFSRFAAPVTRQLTWKGKTETVRNHATEPPVYGNPPQAPPKKDGGGQTVDFSEKAEETSGAVITETMQKAVEALEKISAHLDRQERREQGQAENSADKAKEAPGDDKTEAIKEKAIEALEKATSFLDRMKPEEDGQAEAPQRSAEKTSSSQEKTPETEKEAPDGAKTRLIKGIGLCGLFGTAVMLIVIVLITPAALQNPDQPSQVTTGNSVLEKEMENLKGSIEKIESIIGPWEDKYKTKTLFSEIQKINSKAQSNYDLIMGDKQVGDKRFGLWDLLTGGSGTPPEPQRIKSITEIKNMEALKRLIDGSAAPNEDVVVEFQIILDKKHGETLDEKQYYDAKTRLILYTDTDGKEELKPLHIEYLSSKHKGWRNSSSYDPEAGLLTFGIKSRSTFYKAYFRLPEGKQWRGVIVETYPAAGNTRDSYAAYPEATD